MFPLLPPVTCCHVGLRTPLCLRNRRAGRHGEPELTPEVATATLQEEHLGEFFQHLGLGCFTKVVGVCRIHEGLEEPRSDELHDLGLLRRHSALDVCTNLFDENIADPTRDVDVLDDHLHDVVTHLVQVMHESCHDHPNTRDGSDARRFRSDGIGRDRRHRAREQLRIPREAVQRRPELTSEVGVQLLDRVLQSVGDVRSGEHPERVAELQHHANLHRHLHSAGTRWHRLLQLPVDVRENPELSELLGLGVAMASVPVSTMAMRRIVTVASVVIDHSALDLGHLGEERDTEVPEGRTDPTPLRQEGADVDPVRGLLQHPVPDSLVTAGQDVEGDIFDRSRHSREVRDEHRDGGSGFDRLHHCRIDVEEDDVGTRQPRGEHEPTAQTKDDPGTGADHPESLIARLSEAFRLCARPTSAPQAPVEEVDSPGHQPTPVQGGRRQEAVRGQDVGRRNCDPEDGDNRGIHIAVPPGVHHRPGVQNVHQQALNDRDRVTTRLRYRGYLVVITFIFVVVIITVAVVIMTMTAMAVIITMPMCIGIPDDDARALVRLGEGVGEDDDRSEPREERRPDGLERGIERDRELEEEDGRGEQDGDHPNGVQGEADEETIRVANPGHENLREWK